MKRQSHQSAAERYLTTGVRRADLFPTLKASGRIESSKRTVIECELKNIAVGVRGQRLFSDGASVLLSVIPEGSIVKRGDVLAVLDSSDYEELLRVQRITVERAAADKVQAELDFEIAGLALREFEEGTVHETTEDFEGKIFLARSDLERTNDRVTWSRRMKDKGYIPAAMVTSEQFKQCQFQVALSQQVSAYALFKKFTAPKNVKGIEGTVKAAQTDSELSADAAAAPARSTCLARETSGKLHDPRSARRLCHLRQQQRPRDLHRAGRAGATTTAAFLPPRP